MNEKYTDQPFRVVTTEGAIVDGFPTLVEAKERADQANEAAQNLGIATRYEAKRK